MIVSAIAVGLLIAFLVQHVLGWHIVRALLRQHHRERDLLLNQIMHLSGKTWTPPPSHQEPEPVDELEGVGAGQLPEW